MKKKLIVMSLIAVAATGVFYGLNYTGSEAEIISDEQTVDMPDLKTWPAASQKAAKEMEKKYGKPNGVTSDMLVWNNNGIWLKTIVYKKEMKHDFPKPHTDVIEQWINYRVPLNTYDEIATYHGSVTTNRTNGTISARCAEEAMNILALNLAYDITSSGKTVSSARSDYHEKAMAYMKGEVPAYTQKLNFLSDMNAPDADKPLDMMKEKVSSGADGQ